MYDYLLVGCGLHNAVFARMATDAGKKVVILEKRHHVGGNCYDERRQGINVHVYGPHQFHCRNRRIWDFLNRFTEFNHYRAHIKARVGDRVYSMPPNMMLYHQLWGFTEPGQVERHLEKVRIPCDRPTSLKAMVLDALGEEIYQKFYEGYSRKQWGCDPSEIPVSVGRRLPIRMVWNDRWFDDQYEGIPRLGYTEMFLRMLDGIEVHLNTDYLEDWTWNLGRVAKKTVYTGAIDEFFRYEYGPLEYRTLDFKHEVREGDFQGNAIINYTTQDEPYTRITEHKHFEFLDCSNTIITKEYSRSFTPKSKDIPYYPVRNDATAKTLAMYQERAQKLLLPVIFAGRLGTFRYYDMDQVVGAAMALARSEGFGE